MLKITVALISRLRETEDKNTFGDNFFWKDLNDNENGGEFLPCSDQSAVIPQWCFDYPDIAMRYLPARSLRQSGRRKVCIEGNEN